jgi:hypothetical protein
MGARALPKPAAAAALNSWWLGSWYTFDGSARGAAGAQCATCPEGTPLPSLGLN